MTLDNALPLIVYAFATSITPGPNNLMLMASGANYGVARTLPHLIGVTLGFVLMAIVGGTSLIQVLDAYPIILKLLQVLCFGFVFYLAWRIAIASPPEEKSETEGRPLRFVEAVMFQWINPKAIAMALTTVTAYAQQQTLLAVITAAVIFGCVNLPSCAVWVLMGQQLRRWLRSSWAFRIFNVTMGILLVASIVPVFLTLEG